jgi:hypothetical protein
MILSAAVSHSACYSHRFCGSGSGKTLRFQEEVVASSLEFQALLARMSIETQKQFWEGYFNMFRKAQGKKAE